jgi:hypothetical protein
MAEMSFVDTGVEEPRVDVGKVGSRTLPFGMDRVVAVSG